MKKAIFEELLQSVKQGGEIVRGERAPARTFHVNARTIKALRESLNFSQPEFAALINVKLGTLRNWEQGHREPTDAAKALLHAIRKDPEHVLKALSAG